jgi:hypothetical protein
MTEWLLTGFGLIIGYIEHLQIVTTSNYNAIANSHTPQFTTAHIKVFSVFCMFTGCRLITAFNAVALSASVLTLLLARDCLTTHPQTVGHLTSASYYSHCRLQALP